MYIFSIYFWNINSLLNIKITYIHIISTDVNILLTIIIIIPYTICNVTKITAPVEHQSSRESSMPGDLSLGNICIDSCKHSVNNNLLSEC
jgi:hypothetical protein